MLDFLYNGLTRLAGPAVRRLLAVRAARGKEDAARRHERLGCPTRPRPDGKLVWMHAASVGESLAVLPLVDRLLSAHANLSVMVTTGTVTSAELMDRRLAGPRAFHQYVPVDLPGAVGGFLAHWRPDLVLWMESEFWPSLLTAIRRRGVPCALVNARLSERSFANWRRVPGTARRLLSVFDLALAQTGIEAERLTHLGIREVRAIGNLKYSALPLPADAPTLGILQTSLRGRPAWAFASTHSGEEEMALAAQVALTRTLPSPLPRAILLLAPRHPDRGDAVAAMLADAGLRCARRSRGQVPEEGDDVFLLDSLGEMGLLFRLAPVTAMGGSFAGIGGHNPIEPALLGSAIIHGPSMFNFTDIQAEMAAAGGVTALTSSGDIASALYRLLTDEAARSAQAIAALDVAQRNAGAADQVLAALAPLLGRAGISA